jgi:NADPH-dependent 2,4-dienoyl-CoA reductase/sulfur reductase-like enzyme
LTWIKAQLLRRLIKAGMSTHPSSRLASHYDVAVIGGGPGGAALATFLARQGHRCVVFEQSKFPRYQLESLDSHHFGHGSEDCFGSGPA